MKIAVIGSTGNAGSRIVDEALNRTHDVTALVRDPSKITPRPHLHLKTVDAADAAGLPEAIRGHDALVSAFQPGRGNPRFAELTLKTYKNIVQSAQKVGVPRLLVVGGAGSLLVPGGTIQVVDTPTFPAEYKVESSAMREVFVYLQKEARIDWIYLAPSAAFSPGERTGIFRVGQDHLLVDVKGESAISMEDYAIAVLDELQHPRHHRQRFTVGY